VLEVTPDKKLVWALREWRDPADLGPASSLQLLDEPGVAENGDPDSSRFGRYQAMAGTAWVGTCGGRAGRGSSRLKPQVP
jgi:hypothetical protein